MCGGGGGPMPKPLTKEEMIKATDNPFENPVSGVTAPSWKPQEVADEKKAKEALKIVQTKTDTAEVTPRSSSGMSNAQKAKKKANQDRAKANFNKRKNTRPKGAHGGASDIKLKENIKEVGLSSLGYKIYEFNYKGDNTRYRGAMAQDVITKLPQAIGVRDGYFTVDYDMIDITMEVI